MRHPQLKSTGPHILPEFSRWWSVKFVLFSFNSMFMSLPWRSKLLCGEPHHSGWGTSWGGRMDRLLLYLQRWNLANTPSRHVWTAPAARRRRFQADGGAGDRARERESEAERKRAHAQVGCYPMMARASTAWRNTPYVPTLTSSTPSRPKTSGQNTSLECILRYVLHLHPQETWCDMLKVLSILLNIQKRFNKICDTSRLNARRTHWSDPYETCPPVWPDILFTC